jgi:DNA primase
MDVIAMHQYGLPVAIATCGTALTQQHIKVLQRHTQKLVFLFDSDAA